MRQIACDLLIHADAHMQGQAFDRDSGMKWPLQRLKLYLQSIHGAAATLKLFHDIQMTVVKSLLAVQARAHTLPSL